jgi:hypothetical protein
MVDGPALALAITRYVDTGIPTPWGTQWKPERTLYAIDLRDATNIKVSGSVILPGESYAELTAQGTKVYTSHYEWLRTEADGRNIGRWYLDRADLADPASPRVLPSVNVPGMFGDISGDGQIIYTVDYQYGTDADGSWRASNTLDVLWLAGDVAVLQDTLDVPERIDRVKANGQALYAATQKWWWDPAAAADPYYWRKSTLRVFDASAPTDTKEVKAIGLEGAFAIRDVIGGRLFLTLGGGGWWGWGYADVGVRGGAVGAPVADAGFACRGCWYGGGGQGLLVYNVAQELAPQFLGFFRTFGWVNQIAVAGDKAFLASGMYGVQTVPLAQNF